MYFQLPLSPIDNEATTNKTQLLNGIANGRVSGFVKYDSQRTIATNMDDTRRHAQTLFFF